MKHCPVPSTLCNLCTSLKLLCPTVYEEMHFPENTLFDHVIGVKVTQNIVRYPLHRVTYAPAKFEVATYNSLGEDAITRNMTYKPIDRQIDDRQTLVTNKYSLFF